MQLIKTPADLGHILRARRKQLGWNQAQLAEQIGVSRQWLIDIEKGKPRAELGLVIRTIYALGLSMHLDHGKNETTQRTSLPDIDLDGIVERSKRSASSGFHGETFRTDDVQRLMREQKSAVQLAKPFSSGIPDEIHRLTQEQNSAVQLAKQFSAGIPDDIHRLMREQNSAVELAKKFSSGIPDEIHRLTQEQNRAVQLAKQFSAGIPDDIHRLMREQNGAVELAKQFSPGIPDDIHKLMRESKRSRKSSSPGGKAR